MTTSSKRLPIKASKRSYELFRVKRILELALTRIKPDDTEVRAEEVRIPFIYSDENENEVEVLEVALGIYINDQLKYAVISLCTDELDDLISLEIVRCREGYTEPIAFLGEGMYGPDKNGVIKAAVRQLITTLAGSFCAEVINGYSL